VFPSSATPSAAPSVTPSVYPTDLSVGTFVEPFRGELGPSTQRILYNEQTYKGGFLVGGCLPWVDYLSDLSMMFTTAAPTTPQRIEILGVPDVFHGAPQKTQCADPERVEEIVHALVYSSGTTRSVACEGHTWSVQKCNGSQPVVCVGCDSPCTATQDASNPFVVGACGDTAGRYPRTTYMSLTTGHAAPVLHLSAKTDVQLDSVALTVNMSYPGSVHCGALDHGATLFDLRMIDKFGLIAYTSTPGLISFTLTDLKPATKYDVYCYSTTWYGSKVNTAGTVLAKILVETSPYNPVVIAYQHEYVYRGAGLIDFITVKLNHPPKERVVVSLYATVLNGVSSAVHFLQDVTFSEHYFGASIVALPRNLTTSGDFVTVFANMTDLRGVARNCITQYSGGAVRAGSTDTSGLTIVSVQTVVPVVRAVTFNGDCSSITVKFSADTNQGGETATSFTCDDLLSFDQSQSTMCRWSSNDTLVIQLGAVSNLMVGDTVFLRGGGIRASCPTGLASCASSAAVDGGAHVIAAPTTGSAVHPVVDMAGPTLLSIYDPVWFTTEHSVGSCGRVWQSIKFTVTKPNGVHTVAQNELNQRFEVITALNQSVVSYPVGAFPIGEYNFGVTMCNYLGYCGFNIIRIVVRGTVAPVVSIKGPKTLSIAVYDEFTLLSDVRMQNRSATGEYLGMVPKDTFQYKWLVLQNEVSFGTYNSGESLSEQDFFKFNAYKFLPGQSYEVRLIAVSSSNGVSSTYSVTLFVEDSPPVAIVVGAAEVNLRAGECLTLDEAIVTIPTTCRI